MCVCVPPGQGVQRLDEVVAGALVLLRALQQGAGGVHHVAGQEAVLEAEVDAERLDPHVLHPEEEEQEKSRQAEADSKTPASLL